MEKTVIRRFYVSRKWWELKSRSHSIHVNFIHDPLFLQVRPYFMDGREAEMQSVENFSKTFTWQCLNELAITPQKWSFLTPTRRDTTFHHYSAPTFERDGAAPYFLPTVWKFQDFSVTQILREANFGKSTRCKTATFTKLGVQKFLKNQNSEPLNLLKWQILIET